MQSRISSTLKDICLQKAKAFVLQQQIFQGSSVE